MAGWEVTRPGHRNRTSLGFRVLGNHPGKSFCFLPCSSLWFIQRLVFCYLEVRGTAVPGLGGGTKVSCIWYGCDRSQELQWDKLFHSPYISSQGIVGNFFLLRLPSIFSAFLQGLFWHGILIKILRTCCSGSAPSLASGLIFCLDSSCSTCSELVLYKDEKLLKREVPETSFLTALQMKFNWQLQVLV